ncbi:hypothetical protein SteCoe_15917 [Stentor coeruleus]|uniref:Uncharacterized protein n=1 Tax=Stentor coeruleus TaxID=5963 RepID=A0A1R2C2E4_9CILI|nr:hypothetical protein SteCoe_15917 [Stentor coeruleus]
MKLQLIKTEATWLHTRVGCYVSLDNQLLEVITPLNCPHESPILDIPPEGILRLIFKDMGRCEGYLASISLPLHNFTKSSTLWLPLYTNSSSDVLQFQTSEPTIPRIQVNVMVSDSKIVCDDELFQSFSDIHIENDGEIVVASEILAPSISEPVLCKTSTFKVSRNAGFVEKLVLQLKKYMTLSSEHKNLALMYKEKCLELESRLDANESKIRDLVEYTKDCQEKVYDREMEMMDRIIQQEREICELQTSLSELNGKMRLAQHESFYAKETMKGLGCWQEYKENNIFCEDYK